MEQQEQSTINATVVPAEVAALISRTTEGNMLRVPQYLQAALHELVRGMMTCTPCEVLVNSM